MNQPVNVNFFPWDDISEDNKFPTGCFHMVIEALEDAISGTTSNRMFKGRFACKAPAEFVGMSHFENYVVGTDENPNGVNPGTMGSRNFKKMLNRAQVPGSNDIAALLTSGRGAEVMLSIVHYVEKEGQYAGPANRIADYHRIGEREAAVAPSPGAPGIAAPVGAPPAPPIIPAPTAPPPAPAPTAPITPTAPIVPTPPMAITPPATTAASPPAPAVPGAPGPDAAPQPPAPPAPPAGPTEPTMRCTISGCQQDVPVSQFGAHVQAHATAAGT